MNYNKDLYQILGINKNASQQEINNLALIKVSKDDTEVNKALLVLSEPTKRIEYDEKGWQSKWDSEFEEWLAACHATFESIHSHIGYGVEAIYHPDGEQIWLMGADLNPSLWAPMNSLSADANWIDKIYSINGPNWRNRMKEYENAMLAEIERVRTERKKTPWCKANWEYVDSGNCAKCGQKAKIRDARGEDNKSYCSQKCFYDNWENRYKVPKYEYQVPAYEGPKAYKCVECNYKGYDCYEMGDKSYKCKACFNKELEKLKNPEKRFPDKERNPQTPQFSSDKIIQLEKEIEHYKEKKKNVPEQEKSGIQKIIEELEEKLKYEKAKVWFSRKGGTETRKKQVNWITGQTTVTVAKKNPILELLNWMKKEGIINISLNSNGNLVVEYSGSQSKIVADNNLTDEQKEVKEFFQQVKKRGGKAQFNQKELEKVISQERNEEDKGKQKNNNDWIMPVTIVAFGAIILVLIGVIIQKSRKKGY